MDILEQKRRLAVDTPVGRFVFVAPYKKQQLAIAGYARQLVGGQMVDQDTEIQALALATVELTATETPDNWNWNTFEDDELLVDLYQKCLEHDRSFRDFIRSTRDSVGAPGRNKPLVSIAQDVESGAGSVSGS